MDPRTPVIVGAAQLNGDGTPQEPIDMMESVVRGAALDSGAERLLERIDSVRVVRGINPYRNPGRLIGDRLGVPTAATAHTQIGGQEAYDLVTRTAGEILAGNLDVAAICGAETLRTRRRDNASGNRSTYLPEAADSEPDATFGRAGDFWDDLDTAARTNIAVNFYAMAETAMRHRRGETVEAHAIRISELWESASLVAGSNPQAVLRDPKTAAQIRTPDQTNRMVADPYPKLMTSNLNVDMAAGLILCSAEAATAAGVPRDRWVFPLAGAGAYDHWQTRSRWELDRSPAMRLAGRALIDWIGTPIDDIAHVDLYSCFPIAVQVGHLELARDPSLPFTITGGLTFNGGPLNTYCLHPLARAVHLIREDSGTAFLSGNGGFFTKHSFLALGASPGTQQFTTIRPQQEVDVLPQRRLQPATTPETGTLEAYTTLFDRDGAADHAVLSILDSDGRRTWARLDDHEAMKHLRTTDAVGCPVAVRHSENPIPTAHLT